MKTIMICQKNAVRRKKTVRDVKELCGAIAVCTMLILILGVESWISYFI